MSDTLATMSKDQIFRFRLDDADRQRLDALAVYYSAPAATVVRILVNEKARALGLELSAKASPPDQAAPASAPTPTKKASKAKTP